MRGYDFTRGVLGLDPDARRAWSAIHAEGHARGDPNPLAGALSGAGAELGRTGRVDEGVALLREAIAMDPTAARPRTLLGFLFLRQGRLEDAARELDAAKKINFRETEARTELGFVLLRLGREEEALVELRDVLRIDRRAPRAYVGIGMILAKRERTGEAITAFQNAIQVDPTHGPAYLRLAELLDRLGRPVEAWSAAEQAHDRGEDVAPALWQQLTEKAALGAAAARRRARRRPARRWIWTIPTRRIAGTSPGFASACARTWSTRAGRERAGSGASSQVEFRIDREGRIECAALRRSSGSELLDRYVLSAVRLAQPLRGPAGADPGAVAAGERDVPLPRRGRRAAR